MNRFVTSSRFGSPEAPAPEATQQYVSHEALMRQFDAAEQAAEAQRQAKQTGELEAGAIGLARGVADVVTAPGALTGLIIEGSGSLFGNSKVERIGRRVGEFSTSREALGNLADAFGQDGFRERIDLAEREHPELSTLMRLAGNALLPGVGAAGAGVRGAAVAGGVLGGAAGAQGGYEQGAPILDVLTATALGVGLGGLIGGGGAKLATARVPALERLVRAAEDASARGSVDVGVKVAGQVFGSVAGYQAGGVIGGFLGGELGQMVAPYVYKQAVRLVPALGRAIQERATSRAVSSVAQVVDRATGFGWRGLGRVAQSTSFAVSRETYRQNFERLHQLVNTLDERHLQSVMSGLPEEVAVTVATAYQDRAVRLVADLPKPKQGPFGPRWEAMPLTEVLRGHAMTEATFFPETVFDDFAAGNLHPAKAPYAWQMHPGYHAALSAAVADIMMVRLDESQRTSIPVTTLNKLDKVLGLDGALYPMRSPATRKRLAIAYQQLDEAAAQAQQGRALQLPGAEPTQTEQIARTL